MCWLAVMHVVFNRKFFVDWHIQLFYITKIHYQKYPAVAQPGRAFGCSSRQIFAKLVKQPIRLTFAATEESQAQTDLISCSSGVNPARGIHLITKL